MSVSFREGCVVEEVKVQSRSYSAFFFQPKAILLYERL
jgi:uncharacterized protein (UPF0332 family)